MPPMLPPRIGKMLLRRAAAAAVGGGAMGGLYGYYRLRESCGPDAIDRILSFYRVAFPMVIEYKWLEFKCEKLPELLPSLYPPMSSERENELFEPLHEKWKVC